MEKPPLTQRIRFDRLAYYGLIGVLAIIIGSYATWKLIEFISPQQIDVGAGATVNLKVSDHSLNGGSVKIALPNNLTDTTAPFYNDDINSGPLNLTTGGNNVNIFRIQGTVGYK